MPPNDDAKGTVLFVDDDASITTSLRAHLAWVLPRVRVLTAASAAEGLATLGKEKVDVILSDYRMPGGDGAQFLADAARVAPTARLIAFSATPDEFLITKGRTDNYAVLSKPVDPDLLVHMLTRKLADKG